MTNKEALEILGITQRILQRARGETAFLEALSKAMDALRQTEEANGDE